MITQRIRKANDSIGRNIQFKIVNLFHGLNLNALTLYPSWITESLNGGYIDFLSLSSSPITTGEYTFYFTLGGSPPTTDACLIIEIVDSLTDSLEICNASTSKNIVWISREGGRCSYIFEQRVNYGVDPGQTNAFENNGGLKYTSRGKTYRAVTIFKTGMSRDEIDLFESLRLSIQAWEYDPITDTTVDIILDSKSFEKYNTNEEFYEVSIDYRYSKHINVQVQ
jgi:hypothetical protein